MLSLNYRLANGSGSGYWFSLVFLGITIQAGPHKYGTRSDSDRVNLWIDRSRHLQLDYLVNHHPVATATATGPGSVFVNRKIQDSALARTQTKSVRPPAAFCHDETAALL